MAIFFWGGEAIVTGKRTQPTIAIVGSITTLKIGYAKLLCYERSEQNFFTPTYDILGYISRQVVTFMRRV